MWYVPIKRPTILEQVLLSSPVPISFVFELKSGKSTSENSLRWGTFYARENCIEILRTLPRNQKLAAIIHEISHAKCFKEKCKCWNMNVLGEVHAYEYTLKWLLNNKLKKVLKEEIAHLLRMLYGEDYYSAAVEQVMKTKLWQKCLNYTGGHFLVPIYLKKVR